MTVPASQAKYVLCVCEREREGVCVRECVSGVCVCVCVCVCVRACVRDGTSQPGKVCVSFIYFSYLPIAILSSSNLVTCQ